jgi:hypothetical protein
LQLSPLTLETNYPRTVMLLADNEMSDFDIEVRSCIDKTILKLVILSVSLVAHRHTVSSRLFTGSNPAYCKNSAV